jgi:hypothetical protein
MPQMNIDKLKSFLAQAACETQLSVKLKYYMSQARVLWSCLSTLKGTVIDTTPRPSFYYDPYPCSSAAAQPSKF